ncbi:toll-like receptor 3 isoform X2 [Hyla sarda]|nr:toll-like receptor 3 isoform X2 [Hyla sarda]XP_056415468.1 toll-like receptor 3 isoform X2 [Hyla sarda]XP_056415477.1 toll-like receptor 3 isoform X2 [Hyla sarda]XP_056415483.1 toll-like receptor 3 isoform X2 [Hyla sarda]
MKPAYMSSGYVLYTMYIIILVPIKAENHCKVTAEKADCSHLELSTIPSDLPSTITILDLSHNRLKSLPVANLSRYDKVEHLDVGYNTLHILDTTLCQQLHMLKILILQHNEFTKIPEKAFLSCTGLVELRLNSNGIKEITGNPFVNLQSLRILDVSHNKMTSTALGDKQQLSNLIEILYSHNMIKELKKENFIFLGNNSLQKLDLSSNPVKEIQADCFQQLTYLHTLTMANMTLGPKLTEDLCSQLADTQIKVLILLNSQLNRIHNTTFKGLNSTNLISLDVSKNSLSQIENNSFIYLQHLKNLNLEESQVSHLTSVAFSGLSNVTYLNLKKFFSNSKDPKIDDFSFQWLQNLQYLNMEENKNINPSENTFTGLISLRYLSLSGCTFQTITNKTFASLSKSSLIALNLTKTGLTKVGPGAFNGLEHLEMLDLGVNQIDQYLTGQEFEGLRSIKQIYLSYNKHLTLTSSTFCNILSLEKLNLRKTALTFKSPSNSPFNCVRNLTFLDLGNNNIANIEEDFFSGLHNLRILSLQHNNLARLWKKANPGGPVLFLRGLQNLEILDLLSNGFDEIPADAFKGLSNLNILNLGENNVYILPPSLFADQRLLTALDLHKNLITSVEENIFKNVFSNLKTLNMANNPFDCTCESIAWFASWLNTTNTSVPSHDSQYICNTPSNYHGVLVEKFDNSPCKDNAPFMTLFILSFTVISSLLVLVLLLHFQGWRLTFYWNVLENKILGFKEIDPGNQRFEYDAFLIHAKKDMRWVDRYLIPLGEDKNCNFKFCFEERDFEAGLSRLDLIVNSIRRSRKLIFVITRHFLDDQWCRRFTIQQAIQQAIEQNQDSIVLLFLEDIPDYKLNHSIHLRRGMCKSRCILEWPLQKARLNAFQEKLKIALGSSNIVK